MTHVLPRKLHASGIDRDAALGFLGIIIRRRGAAIDLARAMLRATGKEHPLRHRGLPGINVSDDADVANFFERSSHRLSVASLSRSQCRGC